MSARSEDMHGLAVVEENAGLGVAHDHLRPVFDFPGTFLGKTVGDLAPGLVEPFDEFEKEEIVAAHATSLTLFILPGI